MRSTIGAIALVGCVIATAAAIALAGSTAFAEAADEQRPRLASLRGQDKAVTASRTISSQVTFTAPDELRSGHATGTSAGNHSAGRGHLAA